MKSAYISAPTFLVFNCLQGGAAILKTTFNLGNTGMEAALFTTQPSASWLAVYIGDPDATDALIRDGVSAEVTVKADCADARNQGAGSGSIILAARNITNGSILDSQTMMVKISQAPVTSILFRVSHLFRQAASAIFSLLGL